MSQDKAAYEIDKRQDNNGKDRRKRIETPLPEGAHADVSFAREQAAESLRDGISFGQVGFSPCPDRAGVQDVWQLTRMASGEMPR